MEMKQAMVPVADLYDAYSGVPLIDSSNTVIQNLNKAEIKRYEYALSKVARGVTLNHKDLALFDKIDSVTFEHHGMCLKDSQVTRARIKACKKYNREFIDRDHLVDHMNFILPETAEEPSKAGFSQALGEFMVSRMGVKAMYELHDLIGRAESGGELTLADLELLSKLEEVISNELDWTIVNEDIKLAIDKASKKLGVYFQNLQKVVTH